MVNCNELRYGNLVLDLERNEVDTITAIEENRVGLANAKLPYTPIELIEPIPLTEEWLLRFGFEMNIRRSMFGAGKMDIILPDYSKVFPMGRIYFNSWCIMEPSCKYAHELQNLYFALTGQELELSQLDNNG